MGRVVLVVEPSDSRRERLRRAFSRVDHPVYEVDDAVDALVAIGRAEFGALVASEGRRQLSLRGLCLLARRRHAGIMIFVLGDPRSADDLRAKLGDDVRVLSSALSATEIAETVDAAMARVPAPFDTLQETEVHSRQDVLGLAVQDTDSQPAAAVPEPISELDRVSVDDDAVTEGVDITDLASVMRTPTLRTTLQASEFTEETLLDGVGPELDDGEDGEATILDVERPVFSTPPSGGDTDESARPRSSVRALDAPEPSPRVDASDTEPAAVAPAAQPVEPLFEGELTRKGGPPLLMGVFTQDATGRLEIDDGPAAGTIFFYGGEPVAARHALGDAGLLARLVARGVLRSEFEAPRAPEGLLLSTLVGEGRLRGQAMHEFLREFVRDRVLELLAADAGTYRFIEDGAFLLTTPLLKVNPFGLVVETLRRRVPGAQVLDRSREVVERWVEATPALAIVSERLKPFTRGVDLAAALGTRKKVSELLESSGIDPLHGTLLMLSLVDAHLARFVEEHVEQTERMAPAQVALDPAPTVKMQALPDSHLSDDELSDDEQELREEIFALYMRLKPLTRPAHVLGVPLTASKVEIQVAFEQRMRDLDLNRIPGGSAQFLLISRVNELRAKVQRAFEAMKVQHNMVTMKTPALKDSDDDSNPW